MGLIRDGEVKTRKEHKCHGCLKLIPKGTVVYSQTGTDGKSIYTIYTCDDCRNYCDDCQECQEMEEAYEGYVKECRSCRLNDRAKER